MKKYLLKLIYCPKCFSELKVSANTLICKNCGKKYSIIENKPVFIDEEMNKSGDNYEKNEITQFGSKLTKKLMSFVYNFYFPSARKKNICQLRQHRPHYNLVLNLGGGNKRYGFNQEVNLDITNFPQVDIIADAHRLPFKDESFELVIADAVLEHVKNPQRVVAEIYRVLKNGGQVYANLPFLQRYHNYPDDFTRWTFAGLKYLFAQFKTVKMDVSAGAWVSFVEFNIYLLRLVSRENKFIFYPLLALLLFILTILRPIFLLIPHQKEYVLANAFYYLGEK